MQLSATIRYRSAFNDWTWLCEIEAKDRAIIPGGEKPADGAISIIAVSSLVVEQASKSLSFLLSEARVLICGSTKNCLIINNNFLSGDYATAEAQVDPVFAQATLPRGETTQQKHGDVAFIDACKAEGLPGETVTLASDFLARVRDFSDDTLVEGLHRKWVTKPNNFLAITIQNRNKQYCVHVKKTGVLAGLADLLDVRDDRPGYARFWLTSHDQLDAAVKAARASFR